MKILSAGSEANCLELEMYNSRCIFSNFALGTESETTWSLLQAGGGAPSSAGPEPCRGSRECERITDRTRVRT